MKNQTIIINPNIIPKSCPLPKWPSLSKADFDDLILRVGDIADSNDFIVTMRAWFKSIGVEIKEVSDD
jgi:hypothetical protein